VSTLIRERGIILRSIRHGETSAILTVFTRGRGRIGIIAKGARRALKGGTALGMEVFTEADLVFYYRSTRDLQLLKEFALVDAHLRLRDSLPGVTIGSAVVELLARCLRDEDAHPALFDVTRQILRTLDAVDVVSPAPLWKFELDLLKELGFELQLTACAATGRPLTPPFSAPIRFRLQDGLFFSPDSAPGGPVDGKLSVAAFAVLAQLSRASFEFAGKLTSSESVAAELTRFLQRYLESHLPVRGRLRSLEALRWSYHT